MMAVTIIGILTAIALPQYRSYQAKGRTLEAKIALANLYSKQTAFFTAHRSYVSCLDFIGYNLKPDFSNRIYAVGFESKANDANQRIVNRGILHRDCNNVASTWGNNNMAIPPSSYGYNSGAGGGGQGGTVQAVLTSAGGPLAATDVVNNAGDEFTAIAAGQISSNGFDVWEMDQDKNIRQRRVGY